jgi:hypothetical protein
MRAATISFRSCSRAFFATLLILCLVIVPICTARCASTLCGASLPNQLADSCHHSTVAEGSGLAYEAASLPCTNTQFFFAIPRLEGFSVSLTSHGSVPAILFNLPDYDAIALGSLVLSALSVASVPINAPVPLRI